MAQNPKSGKATVWTVLFSERILKEDLDEVGHAAFDVAKNAIEKKLKIAPDQYGANLHHPLHGFRKLKSSDVRIVYRVEVSTSRVLVLMIGNRRDIWESEQAEILERYEEERGRAILSSKAHPKKKDKRR